VKCRCGLRLRRERPKPKLFSIDGLAIRASLSGMATSTKRAALYVRVSISDRGQTVENQIQPLQDAAGRLGSSIVAVFCDEASGAPTAAIKPGLDVLLKS
jgi:hypothetical protein